jgi:hypothetical protein
MSCEYEWAQSGVIRRHRGTLRSQDITAAKFTTESHVHFGELRWMISDLLDVDEVIVDDDAMEQVVAGAIGASYTNSQIRIAIVAKHPKVIELAKQFCAAVPCYQIRLFSNIPDAKGWASGESGS